MSKAQRWALESSHMPPHPCLVKRVTAQRLEAEGWCSPKPETKAKAWAYGKQYFLLSNRNVGTENVFILFLFYLCVCVPTHAGMPMCPMDLGRSENNLSSRLSSSAMWVPGTGLGGEQTHQCLAICFDYFPLRFDPPPLP